MTVTVVDYAFPPHPSVDSLRAVGAIGVVRYLAPAWTGKVISGDEYQRLRASGIDVSLVWELDARDWMGGAALGRQHAAEAVAQAQALRYPAGAGIYGAADWDMTRSEWNVAASWYAAAFASTVRAGGYRVGVYGPADVLTWCRDEHGYDLFWQARMSWGWSGGRNGYDWAGANLIQRRTQNVGGADCDLNDVPGSDWGAGSASNRMEEVDMAVFHNGLPSGRTYIAVVGPKVFTTWDRIKPLIDAGVQQYQMEPAAFDAMYRELTAPAASPVSLTDEQVRVMGAMIGEVLGADVSRIKEALSDAGVALGALGS